MSLALCGFRVCLKFKHVRILVFYVMIPLFFVIDYANMEFCKKSNGFTVIELVILLIVITILAASTLIRMPNSAIEIDSKINQVANDIRYTQSLAMSQNRRYCFISGVGGNRDQYYISDYQNNHVIHPATGNSNNITLGRGMDFRPINSCIAFNGDGIPYTCAIGACNIGAERTTNYNIRIRSSDTAANRRVRIYRHTGYARII